jgi:hypothetical protein
MGKRSNFERREADFYPRAAVSQSAGLEVSDSRRHTIRQSCGRREGAESTAATLMGFLVD